MRQHLPSFVSFRDGRVWEEFVAKKLAPFEADLASYLTYWYVESRDSTRAYPSQGMLLTPMDFLDCAGKGMVQPEEMVRILRVRQYFLELFNHPERLAELKKLQESTFLPPPQVTSPMMEYAAQREIALSISDIGIRVLGSQRERVARTERFRDGPFVKLGKRVRSVLVGSAMPDVYGSVYALSTMAQCLCLVGVPRNGPFSDILRQADLVSQVWNALSESEVLSGRTPAEARWLLDLWKANVMGVLETEPTKSLKRARALYKTGVRTFRVYSPEPGNGCLHTVKRLRAVYGDEIEIFAGQVVDVTQAQQLEEAGADGLYLGIGGGGRCITGVRSGSVVDWPMLLWQLRGVVGIPVIVEGGASDHIAATLALGATGIGVSRIAAGGTIESPGGMLYCIDRHGRYFKPYGGEASARTKYLDGKMLPFEIPSFVEGETRAAYMKYLAYGVPTIPFHIYRLLEDIILSLVFRGVKSLAEFHKLNPSPLRQKTMAGALAQETH